MLIERSAERETEECFSFPILVYKQTDCIVSSSKQGSESEPGGPEFTQSSSRARSYITKAEPRLARALPALQKQYGSNVNFSSFWFVPLCAVNKVTLKSWSHYYLCE